MVTYETDVRIAQINSMKDILDEGGLTFTQNLVETIAGASIFVIERSLERIIETKEKEQAFNDSDEDDFFDPSFFPDELNAEYDLLTACAGLIGTLMREHSTMLQSLMEPLLKTI